MTWIERISLKAWVTFALRRMVCNKAGCMSSTNTRARVQTVLVYTCQITGTLLVTDTLWFTFNIRVSSIIPYAFTGCCLVSLCTVCIYTTWRWITRLNYLYWSLSCCGRITSRKWITNVVSVTCTDWYMISYSTVSINTTNPRTGINTLLILTSLVIRTIWVQSTFWMTVGRQSKHTRSAGTITSISINSWRITILSTRIRLTWIICFNCFNDLRSESALCKWIPYIAIKANTGWNVVSNITLSIDTTNTWAWINAFVSLTCFV